MNKKDSIEYLNTAFLQFEFSLKLWHYVQTYPLDLNKFDIDLTVTGHGSHIVMNKGNFKSQAEIEIATGNITSMSFGSAVIALWEAINSHGYSVPNELDSEVNALFALIYQLRCAYAHNIAMPKWHITHKKYLRELKFKNFSIDLSTRHGSAINYEDIGGAENLIYFKKLVLDYIKS